MSGMFTRLILSRPLRWRAKRLIRQFFQATTQARLAQEQRLLEKLRRNAASDFGRRHGFASIDSVDAFRRAVPISTYEDLAPYLEQVKAGRLEALFGPGQRVHMFAMTSGTTAQPKFVPVTDAFLEEYRRGFLVWGIRFFMDHPRAMFTPILQMVSSPDEFRTECGIPCGSISGLITQMQKPLVRRLYCVPPVVGRVKDTTGKYYVSLRLALPRDVGFITSANPNTLVHLARQGVEHAETLIRDIADGALSEEFDVPAEVREALAPRIRRKLPRLARRLEQFVADHGSLRPRHYWPNVGGIGTWKGGTVGLYLPELAEAYGPTSVRDLGLLASEGRMTVPVSDEGAAGVLDVTTHFYEFVPEEEIDAADPTVLGCHELEVGRQYFILLTTSAGMHRYNIYDLVRVTGYCGEAPILEFLNKGAHISSLVGEKLTEHQVVDAVAQAGAALGLPSVAFVAAPRWGDPPGYVLLLETDALPRPDDGRRLARAVDEQLRRLNVEYDGKRASHRLAELDVKQVAPGRFEAFDRDRLAARGGTVEQYKHPFLVTELGFDERF